VHKHAVLHLRERRPKVAERVRAAEARKAAVAGAEAALLYTLLQPAQRT
jgi:hypothetical protein